MQLDPFNTIYFSATSHYLLTDIVLRLITSTSLYLQFTPHCI